MFRKAGGISVGCVHDVLTSPVHPVPYKDDLSV